MNDELIERVARAIHAAHMIEKGPLAAWTWEEAAKSYYEGFALAAIAAMQPHIAAEREDAARRALEAAAADVEEWFPCGKIDEPKHAAGRALRNSIRAIDPAQFRGPGMVPNITEKNAIISLIDDAIADSLGPDWNSFEAAHHVLQWLEEAGLQIVSAPKRGNVCMLSHDGFHHADTSMESGPNNCFHCERPML